MLTARILPMPTLDAERYVTLYLSNPLLLAAHPDRMRATAESWANGGYDKAATTALSEKLSDLRHAIVLHAAVEVPQPEVERELLDLAAHPLIAKPERVRLQEKIMRSRPSEYAWLRAHLEAAIIELDAERDTQRLQADALPAARPLDAALAAIRGFGGRVLLGNKQVA